MTYSFLSLSRNQVAAPLHTYTCLCLVYYTASIHTRAHIAYHLHLTIFWLWPYPICVQAQNVLCSPLFFIFLYTLLFDLTLPDRVGVAGDLNVACGCDKFTINLYHGKILRRETRASCTSGSTQRPCKFCSAILPFLLVRQVYCPSDDYVLRKIMPFQLVSISPKRL